VNHFFSGLFRRWVADDKEIAMLRRPDAQLIKQQLGLFSPGVGYLLFPEVLLNPKQSIETTSSGATEPLTKSVSLIAFLPGEKVQRIQ
jgi:hypothetical protein